jgi:histidyl-tRNA synthetase
LDYLHINPHIVPSKKTTTNSKGKKGFQSLRGMHDILPNDGKYWRQFITKGMEISDLHDFLFIETPIVEEARLFEAAVGATTDIVEKEMYVFTTKSRDKVALRPEGTAGLMRSYIQHHLGHVASPLRVFHYGPIFRYERPQAGRYRQFHQWDFDIIGDADPWYDVQVILVTQALLKALNVENLCMKINTVGCRICRPSYRKKLVAYYRTRKRTLCTDCKRRIEANPLRLLDCKVESCIRLKADAPIILNHLCQSCNTHFKGVLELIEENNLDYEPDPHLVRGLDYYNKTVFEIVDRDNHSFAFAGGGRYDYLGEIIGSRIIPAVGAAFGMERIVEYLKEHGENEKKKKKPIVFFVVIGEQAKKASISLINKMRTSGIKVKEAVGKKSMSAQLKAADRAKAALTLIIGQRECFEGSVIIRDMTTGAQETIPVEKVVDVTKKKLK